MQPLSVRRLIQPPPPRQLPSELSQAEQGAVCRFVDEVEAAWGVRFAPGFDPGLRFMAHVWEPLR